jgi:hypothetical protein
MLTVPSALRSLIVVARYPLLAKMMQTAAMATTATAAHAIMIFFLLEFLAVSVPVIVFTPEMLKIMTL